MLNVKEIVGSVVNGLKKVGIEGLNLVHLLLAVGSFVLLVGNEELWRKAVAAVLFFAFLVIEIFKVQKMKKMVDRAIEDIELMVRFKISKVAEIVGGKAHSVSEKVGKVAKEMNDLADEIKR